MKWREKRYFWVQISGAVSRLSSAVKFQGMVRVKVLKFSLGIGSEVKHEIKFREWAPEFGSKVCPKVMSRN